MDEITPKKMGCCSICDALLFEVEERWPDGPLEGEVRVFGKPLGGAKRSTLVLQSGSITDISLCASCEITPENISFVWRRALQAMALEISVEWRRKQAEARGEDLRFPPEHQEACRKVLDGLIKNPPMGVLYTRSWEEIVNA